ncbi:sensor histidine kinase [Chryseolinea lacunae]|uniref:histidine kinase n=1 Tax=Chryseolinea lacunae TaxID=2801331 RepID=A0ABS1L1H0_9BACT|nr:HAMP domain-containing sensor histidine kinase [Chryseolinea lacunae]MBL0745561.1 HAMP domain-containing histidine kinase [Chryseolinea lacunae]
MDSKDFNMIPDAAARKNDFDLLVAQLKEETLKLKDREQELEDQAEELSSQKEELTAAIEELMSKNRSLEDTLTQLRERNHELDQILYRTSHDLRSPLSSIKGILALLQLEPQTDVIRNYGKHIDDKATQMDNLLRSLASLSKSILEEPLFGTIDLNKLIWQVIGEYRHLPSWNQVEVHVELHALRLHTDPALITILFQCLISNAFIFRDPAKKGKLVIRTRHEHGHWIADVIDDGEGVHHTVQPHIFDMFYRGSERAIGNGLGLYIGKKAAHRLKGTLSVHPEPSFTRFTLMLPLHPVPAL